MATEIINKVSSHLMLASSEISFDENENFVNTMELSQMKARRPEHMKEISFNVLHNKKENQTTWSYIGYVDKKKKATEKASEKIIEILKNGGEDELTIKDVLAIVKGIGESNIRSAIKDLLEKKILDSHVGTGKQCNTKYYFLVDEEETTMSE